MKPFFCLIALASIVCGQRQASSGYGAPTFNPAPAPISQPQAQPQAQYGRQTASQSLPQASHGGDHQGLDWLLESVPGTPGTDYPIYGQGQLSSFAFDCNGQIEGGYYADPQSQCQAFHVCIPDGLGGLTTQSFLCPNGTIFNQEYFICDWWFNFDCSQATGLYSRNDEVARERESASLAQSNNRNNNNNNYSPASQPILPVASSSNNNFVSQPAQNNYGQPAQASYNAGRR